MIDLLTKKLGAGYEPGISDLKRLSGYYKTYLEILNSIHIVPSISKGLSERLKSYLKKFQDEINTFLNSIGATHCNLSEKDLLELISQLELSLHKLTEKQLLKATKDLLVTSTVADFTKGLDELAEAIKTWKAFIQSIYEVPFSNNTGGFKQKQSLENVCTETAAKCYQEIFDWIQSRVEKFVGICKYPYKTQNKLSQVQERIKFYKKAIQLNRCLPLLEQYFSLETEQIEKHKNISDSLNKNKGGFQEYCLDFLENEAETIAVFYDKHYERIHAAVNWVINFSEPDNVEQKDLLAQYNLIPNIYFTWSSLIQIGDFSSPEAYESAQMKCAKWRQRWIVPGIRTCNVLSKNLYYREYQASILLKLKGIAEYYYKDYFAILQLLPYVGLTSNKEYVQFQRYLRSFTSAVNNDLREISNDGAAAKNIEHLKKGLQALLLKDKNSDIAPSIYDEMAYLGALLCYLTDKTLQSVICYLSGYYWGLKREWVLDKKSLVEHTKAIPDIFNAIAIWGSFVQRLIFLYTDKEIENTKRYSYLCKLYHKNIEREFNEKVIQRAEEKIQTFTECLRQVQDLSSINICDLLQVEEIIHTYEESSLGVEVLNAIPADRLGRFSITKFVKQSALFARFCSSFFSRKTKELFAEFKKHSDALQNSQETASLDLANLFNRYKELKRVLNMWDKLTKLAVISNECEGQKKLFQTEILGSSVFLRALLSLFKQFNQKADEKCPQYEDVKQQFKIRKTIQQIFTHRFSASEVEKVSEKEKDFYRNQEEQFKEYCLSLQKQAPQSNQLSSVKPIAFFQQDLLPLRKWVGVRSAQKAGKKFYEENGWEHYDEFIQLCKRYGDSAWVLPSGYASDGRSVDMPTLR